MGRLLDERDVNIAVFKAVNNVEGLDMETTLSIAKACKDEFKKLEMATNENIDVIKNHVSALLSIETIKEYLKDNEMASGDTFWKSKDNDFVRAPEYSYFLECLDEFESYLVKKINRVIKEEQ